MPIKELKDATLYIMNEDGTKTELGPIASVDVTEIEPNDSINKLTRAITNVGEVSLKATMDLSKWKKFIRRYMWCNNYRKMHGKPMNRRRQIWKVRRWRYNSIMRRCYGSVRIGNYVWQKLENGNMRVEYVGKED